METSVYQEAPPPAPEAPAITPSRISAIISANGARSSRYVPYPFKANRYRKIPFWSRIEHCAPTSGGIGGRKIVTISRARVDMHVHTAYSGWRHLRLIHPRDSYLDPFDAYQAALERGMSFVAVTDHNTIEGALRLTDDPRVDPRRVIVGEELECAFPDTGQWLHVNLYGLGERDHSLLGRLKADVREVVAYCRERDLLCVLNHPFQSYLGQKPLRGYVADILRLFTHVEGWNGSLPTVQNLAVQALCRQAASAGLTLVQVGGSDAHGIRRVACAYTEASASSAEDFLVQVKRGHCSVSGTTLSTAGMIAEVYRIVGTYYRRLYTGKGDAKTPAGYLGDVLGATACLPFALGGLPAAVTLGSQIRQKAVSGSVLLRMEKAFPRECALEAAKRPGRLP